MYCVLLRASLWPLPPHPAPKSATSASDSIAYKLHFCHVLRFLFVHLSVSVMSECTKILPCQASVYIFSLQMQPTYITYKYKSPIFLYSSTI
jgi:hypothetical protein